MCFPQIFCPKTYVIEYIVNAAINMFNNHYIFLSFCHKNAILCHYYKKNHYGTMIDNPSIKTILKLFKTI